MSDKTVTQTQRSSMDQGAIRELLESDAFVNAMRKNLGLKEDNLKVCDLCSSETEIRTLDPEKFDVEQKRSVHFCSSCKKIVKDPIVETRWIERSHTLMDKEGVEMFITNIRGSADKIQFTSNFQSGEIERIMKNLHKKISHELYQNWVFYGIDNQAMAHKITSLTTNLIWSGYNRALNGKTLEGVVNMGDDRTVKRAESGDEKSGALSKLGLGN